eukprot:CAMPEP_0172206302 /NCGR_PEP_ID=MMETSP1050-20130122/33132_1 /TAXON_ID=233186 /ORGANISM="Cryptomonas curvata, Strain CCAP979/52" /LENGTH=52 /DNA_ID=CAMNT_0012885349 /DNA_START=1038 /DNA_END=1196 /DNA_ORIENTATION=+
MRISSETAGQHQNEEANIKKIRAGSGRFVQHQQGKYDSIRKQRIAAERGEQL